MDRVERWSQGVDVTCVLCRSNAESRDYLFFECSFTSQIWQYLMSGVLASSYTKVWSEILPLLTRTDWDKRRLFCARYTFQVTIHMVWRERNKDQAWWEAFAIGCSEDAFGQRSTKQIDYLEIQKRQRNGECFTILV